MVEKSVSGLHPDTRALRLLLFSLKRKRASSHFCFFAAAGHVLNMWRYFGEPRAREEGGDFLSGEALREGETLFCASLFLFAEEEEEQVEDLIIAVQISKGYVEIYMCAVLETTNFVTTSIPN